MLEQHNFIEVKNIELPNRITHKYFHSINKNNGKRKSETLTSEMENDNSSSLVNNSSKKSKSKIFLHFKKAILDLRIDNGQLLHNFILLLDCSL